MRESCKAVSGKAAQVGLGWRQTHHGQVLQAPELGAAVVLAVAQESHQGQDGHHDNEHGDHSDHQGVSPRFTGQTGELCKETKGMRPKESPQGLEKQGFVFSASAQYNQEAISGSSSPLPCFVRTGTKQLQNLLQAGKDLCDYQSNL